MFTIKSIKIKPYLTNRKAFRNSRRAVEKIICDVGTAIWGAVVAVVLAVK